MMSCIFCLKPANDAPEMALEQCSNCQDSGWSVKYQTNGYLCATDPFPDINWVAIFNNQFYVELDYRDDQTRFFRWVPKGNQYTLITYFNRLEKVNPTNIQSWLDRILKLKVFY